MRRTVSGRAAAQTIPLLVDGCREHYISARKVIEIIGMRHLSESCASTRRPYLAQFARGAGAPTKWDEKTTQTVSCRSLECAKQRKRWGTWETMFSIKLNKTARTCSPAHTWWLQRVRPSVPEVTLVKPCLRRRAPLCPPGGFLDVPEGPGVPSPHSDKNLYLCGLFNVLAGIVCFDKWLGF